MKSPTPRRNPYRTRARAIAAVATVTLAVLSASSVAAQSGAIELIKPRLEIPIPNVTFSGTTLNLIGEYFAGVYKYLLSIVGIFATVMMMVGGFQYLTSSGDKTRAEAGRKRIMNAMAGLILAFGSYAMLYVINPALVQFNALQVTAVATETVPESDSTLGYTNEVTSGDDDQADTGPASGSHPPTSAACPFTLTEARGSKAGRLEFYRQVQTTGVVTATSKRDKVVQIADIADACDVNLGSCGRTAGAINALAGVGDTTCLLEATSKSNNCNDHSKGKSMFELSGRQRREIYARNCALWTPEKAESTRKTLISVWKKYTDDPAAKATEIQNTCQPKNWQAVAVVRKYLKDEDTAGRMRPKGWPDSWANMLHAGDRIVVYNGNNDLVGSHAAIVVGWKSKGLVQVVQGGNGGSGTQRNVTRPGTICLTSDCCKKENKDCYTPLINAWSPD